MKTLLLALSVLLSAGCASAPEHPQERSKPTRATDRAFKGVEIYSWKQDGIWLFALLPGTNRTKPEGMIKATPLKLLDLEECFAGYAEGENIFWVVDAKFGRPEAEVIRQVQSAALKSKVNLVFP
jgi:hypothetical protein